MHESKAAILGLGTALPPHEINQEDASESFAQMLGEGTRAARLSRRLFRNASVETRRTCVAELAESRHTSPMGRGRAGTAERMKIFHHEAAGLAAEASRHALCAAGVDPREISHLILLSTTGYSAPGADIQLIPELGLRPSVERVKIGLMGCFAGINAFRLARQIALAEPGARVLLACVDLCTLHCRADPEPENLVAHALFGDGAGAAVVGIQDADHEVVATLGASATHVQLGTEHLMTWEIVDDGFRMALAEEVPSAIEANVGKFVGDLLDRGLGDANLAQIGSWCVHPGGPAILDSVERALGLDPIELKSCRATLRAIGNTSSASLFFVLERELGRVVSGAHGVMLGFGPGLTFEGIQFTWGHRVGTAGDEVSPETSEANHEQRF